MKVYRIMERRRRYTGHGYHWDTHTRGKWNTSKEVIQSLIDKATEALKTTGINDIKFDIDEMEVDSD